MFLISHGKYNWNRKLPDFDRPLTKRGKVDANIVSNYLKNSKIKPKLILCSSSERTKLAANIFIKKLELNTL